MTFTRIPPLTMRNASSVILHSMYKSELVFAVRFIDYLLEDICWKRDIFLQKKEHRVSASVYFGKSIMLFRYHCITKSGLVLM